MPHAPLFLITGPSGAGKSTVMTRLLKFRTLGLRHFVTTTTREPRRGEQNGHDYWFTTREEFEREVKRGNFYEWAEVYGNYYGSNKREMMRLQHLRQPIAMVVDVQGAHTIKGLIPDAVVIFIDAPKKNLIDRLKARGSAIQDLEARLKKLQHEETFRGEASVAIVNEDGRLTETVALVAKEIKKRL